MIRLHDGFCSEAMMHTRFQDIRTVLVHMADGEHYKVLEHQGDELRFYHDLSERLGSVRKYEGEADLKEALVAIMDTLKPVVLEFVDEEGCCEELTGRDLDDLRAQCLQAEAS